MQKIRKLLILLILTLIAGLVFGLSVNNKKGNEGDSTKNTGKIIKSKLPKTTKLTESIFIPYWNIPKKTDGLEKYNRLIYFGITASADGGINKYDQGYLNMAALTEAISDINKEKLLVLRMLDEDTNFSILNSVDKQNILLSEINEIINEFGFDGIALDLELNSLPVSDITNKINSFVQKIYTEENKNYRKFYLILYGDTFYRKRPYDVDILSKNSDEIMVMAYDFHKSRGIPGPNFPLNAGAKYGYDLKKMTDDFSKYIGNKKLTIIFGMYGYDWLVDEKKRPIRPARALSLKDIQKQFIEKCELIDCVVKRDGYSTETEVNYIDSVVKDNVGYMDMHIVWFEDEESVRLKKEYLMDHGIGNFAYWVYGYF